MKNIALMLTLSVAGLASAQDSLDINYLVNGGAVQGHIDNPYISPNVYIGGFNATLDIYGTDYTLPEVYCVDLLDEISVPSGSYGVTVAPVYDAAAWLDANYGSVTATADQDAGLQLAIWAVTYPALAYSGVSSAGAVAWANTYLAADGNGLLKATGFQLTPTGNYGQAMIYTTAPHGGTNNTPPSVPGTVAALPFLIGLARRRRQA